MNITDVKIRKIEKEGRLRAVVSITVDSDLVLHDLKVVQGSDKLFVAMPSRRERNGQWHDICHPITGAARAQIEDVVLASYQTLMHAQEEKNPIFRVCFTAQKSYGGKLQPKMGAGNLPICLEIDLPAADSLLQEVKKFHDKHHTSYRSIRAFRYPFKIGDMIANDIESLNESAKLISKMDEETISILQSRLNAKAPVCEYELEEWCKELQQLCREKGPAPL
ncbi:septation regulator SpoVG [Anaerotruncus rubiinfantis]|uniref:septation regulator SpoVG n=1 Tax=Anaerotruncus rubiinfantis TaxID=1720200 RepID=UPI000836012C|nr:septation regulator SpoVG [Anaerotruncus rubiinfantis]